MQAGCCVSQIPGGARGADVSNVPNLRRTMSNHVGVFIAWLHANVALCHQQASGSLVAFIPFAEANGCHTQDVADMARAITTSCRAELRCKVTAGSARVRVMATAMAAALGWTYRFVRLLGLVAVPWTSAYATRLEGALLESWQQDVQVVMVMHGLWSREHACSRIQA